MWKSCHGRRRKPWVTHSCPSCAAMWCELQWQQLCLPFMFGSWPCLMHSQAILPGPKHAAPGGLRSRSSGLFCISPFRGLWLTLWQCLWGRHPLPGQSCVLMVTLCVTSLQAHAPLAPFPPSLRQAPSLKSTQGCRDMLARHGEVVLNTLLQWKEVQPTFLFCGIQDTLTISAEIRRLSQPASCLFKMTSSQGDW